MSLVHTIGHSTRPLDELIAMLRDAGVRTLVDVRRHPVSRRHPQFGRDALAASLRAAGIAYVHEADLGGHREPRSDSPNTAWRNAAFRGYADHVATAEFAEAVARVATLADAAVMCAEALPERCHRQLLADALVCRGLRVRHLIGPGSSRDHALHPRAVCTEGTLLYPAAGQLFLPPS
ncbi:MAG TPA: DUF488 domain-containing protein [Vicinamibacteria bacterium]|nr:DUF488 domain-containing protein [Vicinamibacteria bacterium]